MTEVEPIPTLRAFFDSDLVYVFPAPGGSLADHGLRADTPADGYMAALAAAAKKAHVQGRDDIGFLKMKWEQILNQNHFSQTTDGLMLGRIVDWMKEFEN